MGSKGEQEGGRDVVNSSETEPKNKQRSTNLYYERAEGGERERDKGRKKGIGRDKDRA